MHEFHIPMRWADIDQLNHVNNVVYIDYAMEARAQIVDDGLLDAGLPIRRVRVDFTRPMLLSSKPALVRSAIDGEVVTQEIRSTGRVGVSSARSSPSTACPQPLRTAVGLRSS